MRIIDIYLNLMIAGLLTACNSPAPSGLTGSVVHSPSDYALLLSEEETDTIPIATNGTFHFEKQVREAGLYTFMIPGVRLYQNLWIESGRQNELTIDAEDPEHTVLKGDAVKEANFLNNEMREFHLLQIHECTNFGDYMRLWKNASDTLVKSAKAIGNPVFTHYVRLYTSQYAKKNGYRFMDLLAKAGHSLDSDAEFNAYMEAIDRNDVDNMKDNLTFHYLRWKSQCRKDMPQQNYYAMLQVLSNEVTNQEVLDDYGFRLLRMYLTSTTPTAETEEVYQLASGLASESVHRRMTEFFHNTVRPTGSEIPDFDLLNTENQKIRFHKICDKQIVYIDVWSTWCGPCCKEIPYIGKLVTHYKDCANIKFVSISLDKNIGDWKNFLDKHNSQWEQYVVPKEEQDAFLKLFAINGIPRFMIFDAQSCVVTLNADRPSSADIIPYLNGLLKESNQ